MLLCIQTVLHRHPAIRENKKLIIVQLEKKQKYLCVEIAFTIQHYKKTIKSTRNTVEKTHPLLFLLIPLHYWVIEQPQYVEKINFKRQHVIRRKDTYRIAEGWGFFRAICR